MLDKANVTATLRVVDLERARRFYRDKLGLVSADTKGPSGAGATISCGDGSEILLQASRSLGGADWTWQVEDIEAVVERLRAKGVAFEHYDLPGLRTDDRGIARHDDIRLAWFRDTEGNLLCISEISANADKYPEGR
jgi:catechol 2,3-dioxygenase-like lactoylglutathione lyase family enzyme